MPEPDRSKRWKHFHSALQLATQRVCNKWTFEDFEECFPIWCGEEKEGARQMMSALARGMQSSIEQTTNILLEKNNAAQGIDTLHECVVRAREEKKAGNQPLDAWKPDLDPRIAVRAHTIPLLERELERLKQDYEELMNDNKILADRLVEAKAQVSTMDSTSKLLVDVLDQAISSLDNVDLPVIIDETLASRQASQNPILS